jgi:hypothetical protein
MLTRKMFLGGTSDLDNPIGLVQIQLLQPSSSIATRTLEFLARMRNGSSPPSQGGAKAQLRFAPRSLTGTLSDSYKHCWFDSSTGLRSRPISRPYTHSLQRNVASSKRTPHSQVCTSDVIKPFAPIVYWLGFAAFQSAEASSILAGGANHEMPARWVTRRMEVSPTETGQLTVG